MLNDPRTTVGAPDAGRGARQGGGTAGGRPPDTPEERQLEALIAELSTKFLNLPMSELDGAIEDAQRRVCECLRLDASLLFQWKSGASGILSITHLHHPRGSPLPPSPLDAREHFPWTLQRVLAGKTTPVPSVAGLPPEAARDQQSWRELGVKSTWIVPLSAWGNPLIGVLSLDRLIEEGSWPRSLEDRLQAFAQIIAEALTRRAGATALGESEARLASAIDIAELGFYEAAENGRVTYLDWRTRSLFGIPSGEEHLTRDYWVERLHPDDRDRMLEESRRLLSGGQARTSIQYRYLHPERGLLWLHHASRVVACDGAGNATRLIGVIQDITDRKLAEMSLRTLAERYDSITSTTSDGFWEVDGEGRILAANDVTCRMYGYTMAELLTLSVSDFEALQSPAEILQNIARVRDGGLWRFETRHRCKDGRELDVEVSTTCSRRTGTLLAFIRDVTMQTRSAAQLQESLEFNRTILASLVDNIVILDRDGTIIATNDAWERFALENGGPDVLARTGVGTSYLEVCRRAEALEVLEGIESVLSGRRDLYKFEYTGHTVRESRWYLMEVMPFRRAEGGAVVVHRDITERRKAEEELRRLRTDIWHAHRVAQTGAIAASLAHELNQPLAAILSNAQAGLRQMAGGNPDLDEIRDILGDIVQDDKRAAAVIVGLRAMLRRRETERERIDLVATVREVLGLLRSELLARDVEVDVRMPSGCGVVVDKTQVQQVVFNLVTNAIEAMQDLPVERRRLEIALTPTAAGGKVLLAISDRGRGIPEAEKDRIFDAFWSTKPLGMGIGLPICRSIVESHGGQLWFVNNEDQGATFFVSLPLAGKRDAEAGGERGAGT